MSLAGPPTILKDITHEIDTTRNAVPMKGVAQSPWPSAQPQPTYHSSSGNQQSSVFNETTDFNVKSERRVVPTFPASPTFPFASPSADFRSAALHWASTKHPSEATPSHMDVFPCIKNTLAVTAAATEAKERYQSFLETAERSRQSVTPVQLQIAKGTVLAANARAAHAIQQTIIANSYVAMGENLERLGSSLDTLHNQFTQIQMCDWGPGGIRRLVKKGVTTSNPPPPQQGRPTMFPCCAWPFRLSGIQQAFASHPTALASLQTHLQQLSTMSGHNHNLAFSRTTNNLSSSEQYHLILHRISFRLASVVAELNKLAPTNPGDCTPLEVMVPGASEKEVQRLLSAIPTNRSTSPPSSIIFVTNSVYFGSAAGPEASDTVSLEEGKMLFTVLAPALASQLNNLIQTVLPILEGQLREFVSREGLDGEESVQITEDDDDDDYTKECEEDQDTGKAHQPKLRSPEDLLYQWEAGAMSLLLLIGGVSLFGLSCIADSISSAPQMPSEPFSLTASMKVNAAHIQSHTLSLVTRLHGLYGRLLCKLERSERCFRAARERSSTGSPTGVGSIFRSDFSRDRSSRTSVHGAGLDCQYQSPVCRLLCKSLTMQEVEESVRVLQKLYGN